MKIIQTNELTPAKLNALGETEKLHVYNALDCMVTLEVFEAINPQLDNITRSTYEFSKALQGPILEMALHGVLIDEPRRQQAIAEFSKDIELLSHNLNRLLTEGLDLSINHRSHAQLKHLFYDVLKIPPVRKRNSKGVFAPTVNRDALEKIANYFDAEPLANHILALRDLEKKVSELKTSIDPDGRVRTSYNIGGTSTGRLSSSESIFGTGGNRQNIEERLRATHIADPGMKLAYIDLEQAESRAVGAICWNLFGMSNYLDACEAGDLHTVVTKMCFKDLPWTGDLKQDKSIAESPFYRQHSYRHVCKVLGHGSSYRGTPPTMSRFTKIDVRVVKEFQGRFFAGFPEIPMWHGWVERELKAEGKLTSLMGRRRSFFGRRNDDTTIREAIAFDPQSSVADILNTAMLRVWRSRICQLLLQVHDAILIQYPEGEENEIIPQVLEMMKVPVELRNGRILTIPAEAQVGWNWSKKSETNFDGLTKFDGQDQRTRSPKTPILDEVLHSIY